MCWNRIRIADINRKSSFCPIITAISSYSKQRRYEIMQISFSHIRNAFIQNCLSLPKCSLYLKTKLYIKFRGFLIFFRDHVLRCKPYFYILYKLTIIFNKNKPVCLNTYKKRQFQYSWPLCIPSEKYNEKVVLMTAVHRRPFLPST